MAHKRNTRATALAMIKEIRRITTHLQSVWTIAWRPRHAEEYPENQAPMWAALWLQADEMARQAEALKAHALAEWQKVTGDYEHILTRRES